MMLVTQPTPGYAPAHPSARLTEFSTWQRLPIRTVGRRGIGLNP